MFSTGSSIISETLQNTASKIIKDDKHSKYCKNVDYGILYIYMKDLKITKYVSSKQ